MSNNRLRQEEYPAVADFMLESLTADKAAFAEKFIAINDAFIAAFRDKNQQVKVAQTATEKLLIQKSVTARLNTLQDQARESLLFLKSYAQAAQLDAGLAAAAGDKLARRNTEAALKLMREAHAYYTGEKATLTQMPDGFLDAVMQHINDLDRLNTEQNNAINAYRAYAEENRALYAELYQYIAQVAQAGKLIFKHDKQKKEQYTISKLIARVRAAKKKERETTLPAS